MAKSNTTKKKTASKSNSKKSLNYSSQRSSAARKRPIETARNTGGSGIGKEIAILCMALLSVILFLGDLKFAGSFGEALRDFQLGMFGIFGYVFPFLFAFISIYLLLRFNEGKGKAILRCICLVLLFVSLCGIAGLIDGRGIDDDTRNKTVQAFYDAGSEGFNGGVTGGAIALLLYPILGIAGTYAVFIFIFLICLVVVSGFSISEFMNERAENARLRAEEEAEYRQQEREIKEQEKAARRAEKQQERLEEHRSRLDKRVSGVNIDDIDLSGETHQSVKKQTDFEARTSFLKKDEEPGKVPADDFKQPEVTIHRNDTSKPGAKLSLDVEDLMEEDETTTEDDSIWSKGGYKETNSGATFSTGKAKRTQRPKPKKNYKLPSINLLNKATSKGTISNDELKATASKLEDTLRIFGVGATVTDISCGPSVTRYELSPDVGVKISKIVTLANDIKLALAATDIRIEAPIPGKAAVGIEVPNSKSTMVTFRELLETTDFIDSKGRIPFAVGRDISGKIIVTDIADMPHLLIAGATGSGKSVCINTIIMSILYKLTPDEVKLIMIDPKQVELKPYRDIPHLLVPVVTDSRKAAGALSWAVAEMEDRYNKFSNVGANEIRAYNSIIEELQAEYDAEEEHDEDDERPEKIPQIVIIIDEMADLMMVAKHEVEDSICRLAQLARAAGIHLVLATQRPSVNVVTGLIKVNIPSRIAFAVSTGIDSRIIIDQAGAERLLGKGDMLFAPQNYPKPVRVQGAFVSSAEIDKVAEFWANQKDESSDSKQAAIDMAMSGKGSVGGESMGAGNGNDELFEECGRFIIETKKASIGNLQRRFKIGFNRAARIMDQLADNGVVGPEEGKKPRQVLIEMEDFEKILESMYE